MPHSSASLCSSLSTSCTKAGKCWSRRQRRMKGPSSRALHAGCRSTGGSSSCCRSTHCKENNRDMTSGHGTATAQPCWILELTWVSCSWNAVSHIENDFCMWAFLWCLGVIPVWLLHNVKCPCTYFSWKFTLEMQISWVPWLSGGCPFCYQCTLYELYVLPHGLCRDNQVCTSKLLI